MKKYYHFLILAVLLLSNPLPAAPISVAIISDEPGAALDDIRGKLFSTGLFASIDYFNMGTTTPTVMQLQQYASVLLYSGLNSYADRNVLGNNLATYVDGGGGVVQAVFANASQPVGGRFANLPYVVIQPGGQIINERLTMEVIDPLHPIMTGVNTFDGGTGSYRSAGGTFGTTIATWSNGAPLVSVKDIGSARRVDLNFYPPSNAVDSRFWHQDTDGAILMANAVSYAGHGGVIPEPSSAALLFAGISALLFERRKRR